MVMTVLKAFRIDLLEILHLNISIDVLLFHLFYMLQFEIILKVKYRNFNVLNIVIIEAICDCRIENCQSELV